MKKSLSVAVFLLIACVLFASSCSFGIKFRVNFYVDGEIVDALDTSGTEALKMPKDPVKEGYVFEGWYWDQGTWTRPFTANSLLDYPLSENIAISVYAKLVPEWTYDIRVSDDGSLLPLTENILNKKDMFIPEEAQGGNDFDSRYR